MIEKPPLGMVSNELLNPSFEEADVRPVELHRNLAPNPSFEYVGEPVELRRNHSPGTRFDYLPTSATSDVTLNGDGSAVFLVHTPGAANNIYLRGVPYPQDYLGEDIYACIEITNHGPMEFRATVDIYDGVNYQPQNSPETTIPVGETRMVWGSTLSYSGIGEASFGNRVRLHTAVPAGQSFTATKMGFFTGSPPEWFDGDYSPDPYLAPSWTGTPNNSASILSYTPASNTPGGWSTTDWAVNGERSLRVPSIEEIAPPPTLRVSENVGNLPLAGVGTVVAVGAGSPAANNQRLFASGGDFGGYTIVSLTTGGIFGFTRAGDQPAVSEMGKIGSSLYWCYIMGPIPGDNYGIGDTRGGGSPTFQWTTGPVAGVAYEHVLSDAQAMAVAEVLSVRLGFATLTGGQTFSIVARNPGQEVFLDGVLHHTTTEPEETVRITGPGHVGLGEGWWDNRLVIDGAYDGPYFDGDTIHPDPDLLVTWDDLGNPTGSASVVTYTPVMYVSNGWSSDQWSVSGDRSLRVPETLQGGGRNLLPNSHFPPGNSTSYYPWSASTVSVANGVATTVSPSGGISGFDFRAGRTLNPLLEGETYTLSVDVRTSPGGPTALGYFHLMDPQGGNFSGAQLGTLPTFPNDGEWHRAIATFTMPRSSVGGVSVLFGSSSGSATDVPVSVRRPKLERGDTATDWSAAPEDVAIVNLTDEQKFSIVARDAGQEVFLDGSLYYTAKRSLETVVVKSPGYVVLGEGYWDNGMVVRKDYDGPYFDGDTPAFEYQGQIVTPGWVGGGPGDRIARFEMYEVEPWTPTAEWSKPENRRYSIGADRGMLYRNGVGVPWSGLVSVNRNANDGELGKRYLDGVLFNVSVPPSDFSATLEAFTYPDEFDECIGNVSYHGVEGLMVHGQESVPFDLCYRTLQGDGNGYGEEYVLHFVYGCMAVDSGRDHASINDSPEAETFSFEIHGVPQALPELRPSAYFSIDSRKVSRGLLEGLEQVLYGTDGSQPRIPSMSEIQTYFA